MKKFICLLALAAATVRGADSNSWVDVRDGTAKVSVPPGGIIVERTFCLPEGQSAGHWAMYPMVKINNDILRGTTSYREWVLEAVKAGKDQKFYVATLRGVFPGMFLNTGDYSGVARLCVKSLGYDEEHGLPYLVADTDVDVPANSLLHNKTHVNALHLETTSHTESQTSDILNWRHDYSQGDTYLYDARFWYMSDVHSTAGDENGVLFAAFVHGEVDSFRGQVASFDAATGQLAFKPSANVTTLGTGRPLINLNPAKAITIGTVTIEGTGDIDGHIRFSADAPIGSEVVGRYFAITEKSECVPGGKDIRRWYAIASVQKNADGTKEIKIIRNAAGTKPAGAPTLYRASNYGKPLKYIIAPGANVYDVSDAVGPNAARQTLRLTPGPGADFAAGDAIEQAIGPDPGRPVPFRAEVADSVPGIGPAPIFDIRNSGAVQRPSVMWIHGGQGDEPQNRADQKPPWENILLIESPAQNGIVFSAETTDAAILFRQPNNRPQPIKWLYDGGKKTATLTVSPTNGVMKFDGGGIAVPGGLINLKGLSGTATQANNLRGINIPVPADAKEFTVVFPKAEPDAEYAAFVELNWLSAQVITEQTPAGFRIAFATPPGKNAKLHWIIVR